MHLSAIHEAVRAMVQGNVTGTAHQSGSDEEPMSGVERAALRALRRRLRNVRGDVRRLVPPAEAVVWY